ncbi:MAG: hypothetical protein AABY04_03940 [Candidatus Micrarchaeota archaeon]
MRKIPRSPKGPEFIKYLHEFVSESIGEKGLNVLLSMGDGATDEIIEQKTKYKIAEIRSLLNHLHSYGFVEYTREKNMQNGWFTYTWKSNRDRSMQNFLMIKKKEVEKLRNGVATEEGAVFYKCTKGCSRMNFDFAMEHKFRCPTCTKDLKYLDNKDELKRAEIRIKAIQKILESKSALATIENGFSPKF